MVTARLLTVLVLPVGGALLHLLELVEDGARLALLHRVQPLRRRGVSLGVVTLAHLTPDLVIHNWEKHVTLSCLTIK